MGDFGLLNDSAKTRVRRLPSLMRHVVGLLLGCIDSIIRGDCEEDSVAEAMATLYSNSAGRYNDSDLVNYDEAAKILGFESNRLRLKRTIDKYGIRQVRIKNKRCGFRRSDITNLKDKLSQYERIREHGEGVEGMAADGRR